MTFWSHRTFEGNRPSNTFLLDRLTAAALGKLVALYEHSVGQERNCGHDLSRLAVAALRYLERVPGGLHGLGSLA